MEQENKNKSLDIAVIGSGISGLSCAWLLSHKHKVTLYEKDNRLGGHSHTVRINSNGMDVDVDTGFIVFNERTYPNLKAFFRNLGITELATDMSFGVSLERGALEYSGSDLNGIFAQRKNLFKPSYWRMLGEILRFYKKSDEWLQSLTPELSLGELLKQEGFSQAFTRDHLLPMGAAIWSTPEDKMLDYPALSYLRFCQNHGLLQVADRPKWLTVQGGSCIYVNKIAEQLGDKVLLNHCVKEVKRTSDHVLVEDLRGGTRPFDHVVMACHADTSLSLLVAPDELEQQLLSSFTFQRNRAVLHSDESLMPTNRRAWASWNYLGSRAGQGPSVTYWMNRLQHIDHSPLFVTLNPEQEPNEHKIHGCYLYDHPVFDHSAMTAQQRLWELQGRNRTWFCGAWFGYGFHEDGLQSGLAVAEALGSVRRPWTVIGENDRLIIPDSKNAAGSIQG